MATAGLTGLRKKSELATDSAGGNADLCYFPFYPTEFLNYDPIAVNTLSQLASWQIRQCADELRGMGFM